MEEKPKSITWQALEFRHHEKTTLWFVAFGIISAGLIGYGIYAKDMLTLVTFVILVGVGFFYSMQKPGLINYRITITGIYADKTYWPYQNIKKFWVIYSPEYKSVNFETTAYLSNIVDFELGTQDPMVVREFLKNYLQEDLDRDESLTDVIARKVKF